MRILVDLHVECEVASVEEVHFCVRQILLVSLSSGRDERGIVAAPDDEGRWLVLAQPCLPRGVGSDVGTMVVEQVTCTSSLAFLWRRSKLLNLRDTIAASSVRPASSDVTGGARGPANCARGAALPTAKSIP